MIELTRINGSKFVLNPFQIEFAEEAGDTVILLNSGRKMLVKEKVLDIQKKFADFLSIAIQQGLIKAKDN